MKDKEQKPASVLLTLPLPLPPAESVPSTASSLVCP